MLEIYDEIRIYKKDGDKPLFCEFVFKKNIQSSISMLFKKRNKIYSSRAADEKTVFVPATKEEFLSALTQTKITSSWGFNITTYFRGPLSVTNLKNFSHIYCFDEKAIFDDLTYYASRLFLSPCGYNQNFQESCDYIFSKKMAPFLKKEHKSSTKISQ